jgi:predicted dehydrogenase
MQKTTTRWGILGAAQIARKNWLAIRNSGNGVVTAVASRKFDSAARFIKECQRQAPFAREPRPVEGYAELLVDPEIDAVYIPLPTGLRKEWVIAAAKAGKHVLCEKPCASSVAELKDMLAACRRHRVQFMDGVMFMHSRRLGAIRGAIPKNVGRIRRLNLAFSFNAPKEFFESNIRVDGALEPHGCLGDLGWYCIRFALWTMDWKMPREVSGRLLAPSKGRRGQSLVPLEFSGELLFDGEVSAGFYCSFLTANMQLAQISGDRGYLRLDDFVLPFSGDKIGFETCNSSFVFDGCHFDMQPGFHRRIVPEHSHSHRDSQEASMFRNFSAQIHSGRLNKLWPEMALRTQQVMEECRVAAAF